MQVNFHGTFTKFQLITVFSNGKTNQQLIHSHVFLDIILLLMKLETLISTWKIGKKVMSL